jgi:cobalt-precorrin-5B (C1)-methyltransferase
MARIRGKLRCGFSTGTAATAAARAALRHLLAGEASRCVAVRLPTGIHLPILINASHVTNHGAWASVIKDGGDDPDVTHKAEILASVIYMSEKPDHLPLEILQIMKERGPAKRGSGICLVAGEGVGTVTKRGLPVGIGEPAVNPVPRMMLMENLTEELLQWDLKGPLSGRFANAYGVPAKPHVFLPFHRATDFQDEILVEVEIRVPRGLELARHTLNPRLGIVGGISILGTTGLVKPFSHEAYQETIQAELSVAASNGCGAIVLSTGGKSERFARERLNDWPEEAFIQIADFFAFALDEARQRRFEKVVLSLFFGKAVKMAQGHRYTHAHKVPLDLMPVAEQARRAGYPPAFCRDLGGANTAREALDLLLANRAEDLIRTVAQDVLDQASRIVRNAMTVRLFLFGYDGSLLLDLESP